MAVDKQKTEEIDVEAVNENVEATSASEVTRTLQRGSDTAIKRYFPFVIVIAIAALVLALLANAVLLSQAYNDNNSSSDTNSGYIVDNDANGTGESTQADSHEHDWTITYTTVHHDAVTHTEYVEPVYVAQTSYETVCNDCQQIITGQADQHIKDTGHSGYTTNVPIENEVMESEGYPKTIIDVEAYDETVPDKVICTICGAEQIVSADTDTDGETA